ncbi:MAG TPA: hypothetical protein K8V56_21655 [Sporosarcina psychrophila]|uniref:Uncharacterized protein n=1 Tax=Sporosarcina psychrophila TaxID=1476 RepID=A0A921KFM2_SPOPS|nr:hypothetical protein [Sporosarcina psychrophila]
MIESFNVRKEVFEDTQYETLHFELTLDGKDYQGHYKDGEVSWFQMQPDQENHEMRLEDLEDEVKKRIKEWEES